MSTRPVTTAVASIRQYTGDYPAHSHDHVQVLIGRTGMLQLELEGRAAFVDASCGLIVPAGVSHRFFSRAAATVLVIDSPESAGLQRLRRFAVPRAVPLPGGRLQPSFDAQQVLASVTGAPRVFERRPLDLAVLEAALRDTLHRRWSTREMAVLYHLSVPRFHGRFVELTGLAPQAWLRRRRLDEASRWLRQGLPLETTALRTGYASASALAFALRRDRGLGARSLRRR